MSGSFSVFESPALRVMRKITSENMLHSDSEGREVTTHAFYYGNMKRIHSTQGLVGMGGRTNSFSDLPLVALAGMDTRVSIGSSSS